MQTGPEQLRDWMQRRGFTQRETAHHFGWDETFIAKLLADPPQQRKPGLHNAIKIERETGIPVEAWVSSAVDETDNHESAKVEKRQQGRSVKRHGR